MPLANEATMTIMTISRVRGFAMASKTMSSQTYTCRRSQGKIQPKSSSSRPSLRLQTITRKGRPPLSWSGAEEWQRKTKRTGNLAEFFAQSPLRRISGLNVRRLKKRPRKIAL